MRRLMWLLLPLALGLLPALAAATDECVTCHTDSAKLRALIQPPAEIVEEEGEG